MVHPLDLIKVRIQLDSREFSTNLMARQIATCEGYSGFFRGLSAGLMRQATYTTTRLGVYHSLNDGYTQKYAVQPPTFNKVSFGLVAGLAGAVVGGPSEMALLRMMTSHLKPGDPYKGLINTYCKIAREEGVLQLWRGGTLTLLRSVTLSAVQIGISSTIKGILADSKGFQGYPLHLITAVASSLLMTVIFLPVDFVKTRYQALFRDLPMPAIVVKNVKKYGVFFLWRGFCPYFFRNFTHTISTLFILEEIIQKKLT